MTKYKYVLLSLVFCGLVPWVGLSEELGDPAPELGVKEWVKGGPVEIKPGTNIYVVVIFEGRIKSITNTIARLNELQNKYRDNGLIVVGINDEPVDKVRSFVNQPGLQIDFAVGADIASRTANSYMHAFRLHTIPRAFLVGKDGKFLWQGEPSNGLDVMVGEAIADRFDLARAKETDIFRGQIEAYRSMAHRGDPRARAAGEQMINGWTNNVRRLTEFAYYIIDDTRNPRRDMTLAGQALDLAEKNAQTNSLRLLTTRAAFLIETGKSDQAIAMTKDAIAAAKDPKEKAVLENYLKKMEARAKAQKEKAANLGTNAVDSVTSTNSSSTPLRPNATRPSIPKTMT